MGRYYMWNNKTNDWERKEDGTPFPASEAAATFAMSIRYWAHMRFVPEERASTFEKKRRAEIEREEELLADHNYRKWSGTTQIILNNWRTRDAYRN